MGKAAGDPALSLPALTAHLQLVQVQRAHELGRPEDQLSSQPPGQAGTQGPRAGMEAPRRPVHAVGQEGAGLGTEC